MTGVRAPRIGRLLVAGTVVILVVATAAATWGMRRQVHERQESTTTAEAARLHDALERRMDGYVQILLGGRGLFDASDQVTRSDWLRYVETLDLDERFRGFKSLSWAPAVPDAELGRFVADVRAQPLPEGVVDERLLTRYQPRSPTGVPGETAVHSPILYVAPFSPENQAVLGVDMMQDPSRRAAMEAAAASGDAVLSPRLRLASQSSREAGFIAYLAVETNGEVQGWLTAAFRAGDFIDGLLGTDASPLDFELHDGEATDGDSLLYSTATPFDDGRARPVGIDADHRLAGELDVAMPGRTWTLRYSGTTAFVTPTDDAAPWLVALGGLSLTVLVVVIARAAERWRRQTVVLEAQGEALRRSEAQVRHQATHDPLTGLANRTLLRQRLTEAVAARSDEQRVALAYIDIDGFKPVNDDHGHGLGDELLRAIGARISARVRSTDTVARVGGDEFAVVLVTATDEPDRTAHVASELVAALRTPFALGDDDETTTVRVSASIGVASIPDDADDLDELIGRADAAMYRAKRDGGSRWEPAATGDQTDDRSGDQSGDQSDAAGTKPSSTRRPSAPSGTGSVRSTADTGRAP